MQRTGWGGTIIFPTSEQSLTALGGVEAESLGTGIMPDAGGSGGAAGGGGSGLPVGQSPAGSLLIPMAVVPPPPLPSWACQLREDCDYPLLGMPRDLNGDSIIDGRDHGRDYLILPVQVRIEWESTTGPRAIDLYTMLTRFKKDE